MKKKMCVQKKFAIWGGRRSGRLRNVNRRMLGGELGGGAERKKIKTRGACAICRNDFEVGA